jgi:nicotinamidase-related amidase
MTLPLPGMAIERPRTALVITDLQNDFLSPGGAAGGLMKDSLAANSTVRNIEALLRAARDGGYPVFLSPYYYPSDTRWVAPVSWSRCVRSELPRRPFHQSSLPGRYLSINAA